MNLRLDETGVRLRLSPIEFSILVQKREVNVDFPLGMKAIWNCELKVGSSLYLKVSPNSILVEIPEEMLRCLELGVAGGKKEEHEVSELFHGAKLSFEVDYFQSRNGKK